MTMMPSRPPQRPAPTDAPPLSRRSLVQAAGAWAATAGWQGVQAQTPETLHSQVIELRGDVLRNGTKLSAQDRIAAGDQLETGPGSRVVLTVGDSAFLVRENTRLALEGENPATVRLLRLLSGAVASVWRRGVDRQIVTPTMTAGIRGTGVYAEVLSAQDLRSYFCNCYGTVDLSAGGEQVHSESQYHQSYWAEAQPRNGRTLFPAEAINHTDEEMEMLAALVQQRTAWQITGRKGSKDGSGKQSPYGGYRYSTPQPAPEPHYSPN